MLHKNRSMAGRDFFLPIHYSNQAKQILLLNYLRFMVFLLYTRTFRVWTNIVKHLQNSRRFSFDIYIDLVSAIIIHVTVIAEPEKTRKFVFFTSFSLSVSIYLTRIQLP